MTPEGDILARMDAFLVRLSMLEEPNISAIQSEAEALHAEYAASTGWVVVPTALRIPDAVDDPE